MTRDKKYYAPKGQKIIAQGFSPGLVVTKRCALKVAPDVGTTGEINAPRLEQSSRPPLSGRTNFLPNPGLKPWAMVFRPFGAESTPSIPNA
jgi:hypothetical protein